MASIGKQQKITTCVWKGTETIVTQEGKRSNEADKND
jgi:hypothetical protein